MKVQLFMKSWEDEAEIQYALRVIELVASYGYPIGTLWVSPPEMRGLKEEE